MTITDEELGASLEALITEMYPLCRSITGNGVRETLAMLGRFVDLQIHEVPTGTRVFDWTVPREWNIRDAYVKNASGERVIDFRRSNLHVVGYSVPVHERMSLETLRAHLHTLPEQPDWIPYRNSYYRESWGFCLTQRTLDSLPEGEYEVCIDSSLHDGSLTYAEALIPGQSSEEILVYAHVCHPSLCNDNLTGLAIAAHLAQALQASPGRFSYRFVFAPSTIGSICWLQQNQDQVQRIRHGLVLSLLGDAGALHYKKSRRGDSEIDRAACYLLRQRGDDSGVLDFSPYGYDERQFCSPGFDLPVGRLTRTPNGCFPQYHTSGDDLEFVQRWALVDSYAAIRRLFAVLEHNHRYRNTSPHCEPQLGKRGLFGATGGRTRIDNWEFALLWVLNLSDGGHSVLDIAERSGLDFFELHEAARALHEVGLLVEEGG